MAMTGYLANGICYASLDEAQDVYYSSQSFSHFFDSLGHTIQVMPYKTTAGTWSIRTIDLTSTTILNDWSEVVAPAYFSKNLPACEPTLSQYPQSDFLVVVAVLILFALGYQSGMHR